jgi:hypothetical protein
MTAETYDEILDSLFHGCALTAYLQITQGRVIHRQFETDIFKSRFSRLLTTDWA